MKTILLLALIFLINSCGSIPQDTTPAPIENDLFTLELATHERRDVGVIGGVYDLNKLTDEYLEFILIGKGTYTIKSQRCLFEKTQTYSTKSPRAEKLLIKDLVKDMPDTDFACIFSVQLFIDGLDRGFKGQFYMMKKEDFLPVSMMILEHEFNSIAWFQISDSANLNLPVKFNVTGSGQAFYEGCGTDKSIKFNGPFQITVNELTSGGKKPECVYSVGLIFDDGRRAVADINLKIFRHENIALGNPQITYENERLSVVADSLAAYVAIDDNYKKGTKISEKVKKDKTVLVRVMTANGRYELLGVRNGEIVWTASRKY